MKVYLQFLGRSNDVHQGNTYHYHKHLTASKCAEHNYTHTFKDPLHAKKILPHTQRTLKKAFIIINCLPFAFIKWLSDIRYSSPSCSLITRPHGHLGSHMLILCSPQSHLHATCSLVAWIAPAIAPVKRVSVIRSIHDL